MEDKCTLTLLQDILYPPTDHIYVGLYVSLSVSQVVCRSVGQSVGLR